MVKRILRRLFAKAASLVGIPEVQSRLDAVENSIEQIDKRLPTFERFIDRRITEQLSDLEFALTQLIVSHTETALNVARTDIYQSIENLTSELARHRRYVENLRLMTSPASSKKSHDSVPETTVSPIISDALYMALEDTFRGSHSSIKNRQSQYLNLFTDLKTSGFPLLDIGCGRGEWLNLLREEGFDSYGVDTNSAAVHECQEAGLDVRNVDLLTHLRSLPNESMCGITMFQVLEHLPFNVLVDAITQIRRVLIPGGLFIGEVPNSENLSVAASTFWIDPTHQRPLHPKLLKFVATEIGFTKVDGIYSTRLLDLPNFHGVPKEVSGPLSTIFQLLHGEADFALTAWA